MAPDPGANKRGREAEFPNGRREVRGLEDAKNEQVVASRDLAFDLVLAEEGVEVFLRRRLVVAVCLRERAPRPQLMVADALSGDLAMHGDHAKQQPEHSHDFDLSRREPPRSSSYPFSEWRGYKVSLT